MIDLNTITWNDAGLIPVIAQAPDGRVLMLAYANREALGQTLETGLMHYWSRSRQALWQKGETSGNTQRVVSLQLDCDHDALLAIVEPTGPACHTGQATCFGDTKPDILTRLWQVFEERKNSQNPDSYVKKLLEEPRRLRQKVGEEGVEVALAEANEELVYEAADLVFHLCVLLFSQGLSWGDLAQELERRRP